MNLNYSINNGLQIVGVDTKSPIILDNDQVKDSPEIFFLWLKSNRKELNVVGNIATKDGHPTGRPLTGTNSTFNEWNEVYAAFEQGGLKNVPRPVLGATRNFNPSAVENSAGADLIISEAKKCSPERPLVIIVGGQCSTVANAFAKDKTIGPNLLVMHVDGKGQTQYNDIDSASSKILLDNGVSYLNWSGDQYGWYTGAGYRGSQNPPINRMPGVTFVDINNAFARLYKNAFSYIFNAWGSLGDAAPALYMSDHSLWQNVVRKTKTNQTVTGAYDYLLVSQNKWADYGPQLSSFMNNPQSYVPVTTVPPVNNAPTISILTPSTTYSAGSSIIITATASDDKAVSKVEFFNGSIKLGESLTSPYSWVINNATAGTYNLTGKATDNEGASTVSSVRVVTVSGVVVQPPQYPVEFVIGTVIEGPVPKVTIRAGSPPSKPILDFELQRGPQGIPGSGNTKDVAKYNVMDFGAKGTGGTVDDSIAFQNCANAAILGCGDFVIPPPPVEYVISKTIVMKSPTNQIWMNLTSWGWGAGTNHIEYRGPSNSSVFYVVGLKGSTWQGLKVRTNEGLSNVVTYDFDATPAAQSTTFNTIRNFYTDLGNQSGNIAFRFGRMKEGENHGDICHYNFENSVVYGKFQDPQPNTIGYQILGRNALAMSFYNCFTAFCDIKYTNKAIDGRRGNGCVAFYTCGSSQNNVDFSIHSEQTYLISGGRYEGTKKRFLEILDGAHAAVKCDTVQIDEIGEGDKSGNFNQLSPFLISSSSTLSIEDCIVNQKAINKSHLVDIVYQGPHKSTLKISGGAVRSSAPALYKGKNANIRVYVEGVNKNKLGDIYSTDIWPDEKP